MARSWAGMSALVLLLSCLCAHAAREWPKPESFAYPDACLFILSQADLERAVGASPMNLYKRTGPSQGLNSECAYMSGDGHLEVDVNVMAPGYLEAQRRNAVEFAKEGFFVRPVTGTIGDALQVGRTFERNGSAENMVVVRPKDMGYELFVQVSGHKDASQPGVHSMGGHGEQAIAVARLLKPPPGGAKVAAAAKPEGPDPCSAISTADLETILKTGKVEVQMKLPGQGVKSTCSLRDAQYNWITISSNPAEDFDTVVAQWNQMMAPALHKPGFSSIPGVGAKAVQNGSELMVQLAGLPYYISVSLQGPKIKVDEALLVALAHKVKP